MRAEIIRGPDGSVDWLRFASRIHLNDLGQPNAAPVPRDEYLRLRAASA
jgi:hypothetical protein